MSVLQRLFSKQVSIELRAQVLEKKDEIYVLGVALDSAKPRTGANVVPCCKVWSFANLRVGDIMDLKTSEVKIKKINSRYGIDVSNPLLIGKSSQRFSNTTKEILHRAQETKLLKADVTEMNILEKIKLLKAPPPTPFSNVVKLDAKIFKAEAKQQIVYSVALAPDVEDSQGDVVSAEDIEIAAHKFMEELSESNGHGAINIMHETPAIPALKVIESFIAPVDYGTAELPVRKGSWVLAVKVYDKDIWKMIEDGTYTGFSIEGTGRRE